MKLFPETLWVTPGVLQVDPLFMAAVAWGSENANRALIVRMVILREGVTFTLSTILEPKRAKLKNPSWGTCEFSPNFGYIFSFHIGYSFVEYRGEGISGSLSRQLPENLLSVGPDGLEPSTHGLKVRCSTD